MTCRLATSSNPILRKTVPVTGKTEADTTQHLDNGTQHWSLTHGQGWRYGRRTFFVALRFRHDDSIDDDSRFESGFKRDVEIGNRGQRGGGCRAVASSPWRTTCTVDWRCDAACLRIERPFLLFRASFRSTTSFRGRSLRFLLFPRKFS